MIYRMIGIDLDGTLLDGNDRISNENLTAIAHAQKAGAYVVPCTGRGWREAKYILDRIPGLDMGVFVTGASVVDVASGRSIDLAIIEPHLAIEIVQLLQDELESVLVFQEAELTGCDYLVTGHGELEERSYRWFELTESRVRTKRDVTPKDLHHTLRVGMILSGDRVNVVTDKVKQHFGDRVFVHSFVAVPVVQPEDQRHVLEIFASGVDKWRGLSWIAAQHGWADHEVATIGDQINDIAMMVGAGCGIAMGNAADEVKYHARHVTRDNDRHGVAYAIGRMLDGEW